MPQRRTTSWPSRPTAGAATRSRVVERPLYHWSTRLFKHIYVYINTIVPPCTHTHAHFCTATKRSRFPSATRVRAIGRSSPRLRYGLLPPLLLAWLLLVCLLSCCCCCLSRSCFTGLLFPPFRIGAQSLGNARGSRSLLLASYLSTLSSRRCLLCETNHGATWLGATEVCRSLAGWLVGAWHRGYVPHHTLRSLRSKCMDGPPVLSRGTSHSHTRLSPTNALNSPCTFLYTTLAIDDQPIGLRATTSTSLRTRLRCTAAVPARRQRWRHARRAAVSIIDERRRRVHGLRRHRRRPNRPRSHHALRSP